MRHGEFNEQQLEEQLNCARLHEPLLRPRHARRQEALADVPARASCSASASTPPRRSHCSRRPARPPRADSRSTAILCLPILFAAGMSLLDTIDGAFMNFAYGWAFSKPVRKVFYNITITALSVAVALIVGSIELLAVFADKLEPERRHLGLRLRTSTSTSSATSSSACSSPRGPSPWPCGTSGASRSAGRRGSSRASRAARAALERQPVTRRSTCRVTRTRRAVLPALAALRREHAVRAAGEVGDAPAHGEAAVAVEQSAGEHDIVDREDDARLAELDLRPAACRARRCASRLAGGAA